MRLLLVAAYAAFITWSARSPVICSPDILTWSVLLMLANLVHLLLLAWSKLPPSIPAELTELYATLFIPVAVTKREFKELLKYSELRSLDVGEHYVTEAVSRIDQRLSILVSGRARVTCENVLLHEVSACEFLDSSEFEYVTIFGDNGDECDNDNPTNNTSDEHRTIHGNNHHRQRTKTINNHRHTSSTNNNSSSNAGEPSSVVELELQPAPRVALSRDEYLAQCSIAAADQCRYLTWKREDLLETFSQNYRLKAIMNNLIGKDITHKLYLINESHRHMRKQGQCEQKFVTILSRQTIFMCSSLLSRCYSIFYHNLRSLCSIKTCYYA